MTRDAKLKMVRRTLFLLLRSALSELPYVGGIIDTVVFTQIEDHLRAQTSHLNDADLDKLITRLPSTDTINQLEARLQVQFDALGARADDDSLGLLRVLTTEFDAVEDRLEAIDDQLQVLPTLNSIVSELRTHSDTRSAIRAIERQRAMHIERLSANQRALLGAIPSTFIALPALWETTLQIIPSCGYKEFRFRLHELEWLDLLERTRRDGVWQYRRRQDDAQ